MKAKQKLSILVIEDSSVFLDIAVHMLEDFECYTAKTIQEGFEKYKSLNPDIIFLDIALPDGNGHDLLLEIKRINPDAFVVMLTQSKFRNDVIQSIAEGASGYILKPLSRHKIKEYLERYQVISSHNKEGNKYE